MIEEMGYVITVVQYAGDLVPLPQGYASFIWFPTKALCDAANPFLMEFLNAFDETRKFLTVCRRVIP